MSESTKKLLRAEKLIALIENNDDDVKRANYIKDLGDLRLKTERIFKILENFLLSDKNYFVRTEAAKSLILTFREESKVPILWAIQHEKSAFFFKFLLGLTNEMDGSFSEELKNKISKRFEQVYELHENDARVLWDLELHWLSSQNENKIGLIVDYRTGYYMERYGHVRTLWFKAQRLNALPDSIGSLTELRYLNISKNNLTSLPDSMKNLKNLRKLDLSSNSFETLPKWLANLPKLKQLRLNNNFLSDIPECVIKIAEKKYAPFHILEGVVPQEATVLGILDILLGYGKFVKLDRNERDISPDAAYCYNINDDGHITAILAWDTYPTLAIFPEQICELQYLEELYLSNQNIKKIPESINKLKLLGILGLSCNPNIDIPESAIPYLKRLKRFDCDRNILMKFGLYNDKLPTDVKRILHQKKMKSSTPKNN